MNKLGIVKQLRFYRFFTSMLQRTAIKLSDFPNNQGLQPLVTQVQLLSNLA